MNDSLRGRRTALALLAATMLIATQGRPRAGEAPLLDLGSTRTKADHARLAPARSRPPNPPPPKEVLPPPPPQPGAKQGHPKNKNPQLWGGTPGLPR